MRSGDGSPLGAFTAALVLSGLGGLVKLYGGARYGSLAVLVDGVTCIANLAAGLVVLHVLRIARRPPDADHPFGHRKYVYTGVLATLIFYSMALGVSISALLLNPPGVYNVEEESALYALLGGAFYSAAVLVSRTAGVAGRAYAGFTLSEVLESIVSGLSALGGALLSTLIDYAGALVITGYLLMELVAEARRLNRILVDWAHPQVYNRVKRLLEQRGLEVVRLRLRLKDDRTYHGDATVRPSRGMPRDVAELLVTEAVEQAAREMGVELTVTIETEPRKPEREKRVGR